MSGTEAQAAPVAEAAPVDDGPREIFVGQPVEQEKPAEAAPEAAKTDAAGLEEEAQPQEEQENKSRRSMQDRFDEMTRARREAERDAEYWKTRAKAADAPQKAEGDGKPQREGFQSDEAYQEALVDWKVDQRLSQKEANDTIRKAGEAKATSWGAKLESARAEIKDYSTVMNSSDAPVAPHVADALMEHEYGAKVAYEMAKNPDLIEKLNGMTPTQAAFEVAKLGTKFDKAPEAAASSPKPAAVSKAPAPAAKSVGASRSTAPSVEEMSMTEYMAYRKQHGLGG